MKKRLLGNSSLYISEISLGCMSLPPTLEAARPIVEAALDAGINYFDTADLYDRGVNEEIIGTILKPYRQHLLLATKVGNRWSEHHNSWHWDPSPQHIKQAVYASLQRLQTDYIDVYQLHGGTIDDPWEEIIDTLNNLKKEGLIRAYGISSIRPNVLQHFLPTSEAISVMMQYSLLDRRPEEWFHTISHNNASIITRGTVAKGLLTAHWKERLATATSYHSYSHEQLRQTLEILNSYYKDLHALALAFNLSHPTVASTAIGASSKQQLLENIAAYQRIATIGDLQQAITATKADIYTEHRE